MRFKDTGCCAIQEITSLSSHYTGLSAMVDFCTLTLKKKTVSYHGLNANRETLYSFYMFTASVYPGKSGHNQYGPNFYEFIKEHGLGEVWQSSAVQNHAYHADHAVQIYIWQPDTEKVKEWWDNHNKPKAAVVEEVAELKVVELKAPKKRVPPKATPPINDMEDDDGLAIPF